jgi:hypothetical protein
MTTATTDTPTSATRRASARCAVPTERIEPPFNSKAEYIEPTTIDEARLQMCAELHRALYGDVWARPQSARDVWVDMLERIDRASRALRR